MDIKIEKLTKINNNRILGDFENNNIDIHTFGVSKKYQGEGVSVCILGSGLPCHDNLPKFSIFETFTEDKDPIIDTINFSTIIAGILASEKFGLVPDVDLIFARVIDSKGQIFLSSLISGILWACIKEANIVICPCEIPDEILEDIKPLLRKLQERNMMLLFPTENEKLKILKLEAVLGIKNRSNKENFWKIKKEENNNLINIEIPKNQKIYSTFGLDKYIKLYNREISLPIASSILMAIYCRQLKKKFEIVNKNIYWDLNNLKINFTVEQ
jgi:hypothetical protein